MRITYGTHVFCSRCELTHLKTDTKLIPNWGYKCPKCGNKCRVKPKYTVNNYLKKHPFEPTGRLGRSAIRREILAIAQGKRVE